MVYSGGYFFLYILESIGGAIMVVATAITTMTA